MGNLIPIQEAQLKELEGQMIEVFFRRVPIGHERPVLCYDSEEGALYLRRATRTRRGVVFVDADKDSWTNEPATSYLVAFAEERE